MFLFSISFPTRMAKLAHLCLLVLYIATIAHAKPTTFIVSSCKATIYSDLCVRTLSVFQSKIQQSPRQMTQTALALSLSTAKLAKTYVSYLAQHKGFKSSEYAALHDCMEEVSDTVDRLKKSFEEMKRLGKTKGNLEDFKFHMSNVETWVSAALTDESTCVDGFEGNSLDGKVKNAIKARCTVVAKVTSNALALVNRYASRHL